MSVRSLTSCFFQRFELADGEELPGFVPDAGKELPGAVHVIEEEVPDAREELPDAGEELPGAVPGAREELAVAVRVHRNEFIQNRRMLTNLNSGKKVDASTMLRDTLNSDGCPRKASE